MKTITSKLITLTSALALLATFSAPAFGAEEMPKKKGPSAADIKKYDKNGDGSLDEAESTAMKADKAAKKKEKDAAKKSEEKAPEKK